MTGIKVQMPFRDVIAPLVASKTLGKVAGLALAMGVYSLLAIGKEYTWFANVASMPSQVHAALSYICRVDGACAFAIVYAHGRSQQQTQRMRSGQENSYGNRRLP